MDEYEKYIKIFNISKEVKLKIKEKEEYKDKIIHFLHDDKLFRIGNTNISYRNAVYLEKVGLLKEKKDKSGWRKLNFIDAIYFDLLVELRKFGMTAKKLVYLKRAFYEDENIDKMDFIFLAAFYGYEITLVVFNDGSGFMSDPYLPVYYTDRIHVNQPRIIIKLNPYINKALSILGIPTIKVSHTMQNLTKGGFTDK